MYVYIYILYVYIVYIYMYVYIYKVSNDNKSTKVYNGLEVQALYDASNLGGLQWSDPKGLQCNEKTISDLGDGVGHTSPILDPGHLGLSIFGTSAPAPAGHYL